MDASSLGKKKQSLGVDSTSSRASKVIISQAGEPTVRGDDCNCNAIPCCIAEPATAMTVCGIFRGCGVLPTAVATMTPMRWSSSSGISWGQMSALLKLVLCKAKFQLS